MSTSAVHPLSPSAPPVAVLLQHQSWTLYRFEASEELPVIDCSVTIKRTLFNDRWLKRWDAFQDRTTRWLHVCFAIGEALICTAPFLDKYRSQRLSVVASVLLFFPVLTSYITMRLDVLCLLVRTYEFWYFTLVSGISNTLIMINLGDIRIVPIVYQMLLYHLMFLIDAKLHAIRIAIVGSFVGGFAILGFLTMESLKLIKDYDNVTIATYPPWRLTASDIVENGLTTVAVMLFRNAYRKRLAVARMARDCATTRCVTLRCPLRFVAIERAASAEQTNTNNESRSVSLSSTSLSQMRLVSIGLTIDANNLVQRVFILPLSTPCRQAQLWSAIALGGITSSVISVVVDRHPLRIDVWLAIVGAFCTVSYTWRCFVFQNRQLLRHMLVSFDFVFLTAQTYLAHLVLCILFEWDAVRCLRVLVGAHWIHWVFTLDSLTPVVRERLALAPRPIAIVVLISHIVGAILLGHEVLFRRAWGMDDCILISVKIAGRRVDIKAVPFLFSRVTTTVCWCACLLWRFVWRRRDELLLIRGAVEFDDHDAQRKLRGANKRQQKHRGERLFRSQHRPILSTR